MPWEERDVSDLLRGGLVRLRAFSRRYPWWLTFVLLAYIAWWGITKLQTQKICLQAGYTDSAVAWDLAHSVLGTHARMVISRYLSESRASSSVTGDIHGG